MLHCLSGLIGLAERGIGVVLFGRGASHDQKGPSIRLLELSLVYKSSMQCDPALTQVDLPLPCLYQQPLVVRLVNLEPRLHNICR